MNTEVIKKLARKKLKGTAKKKLFKNSPLRHVENLEQNYDRIKEELDKNKRIRNVKKQLHNRIKEENTMFTSERYLNQLNENIEKRIMDVGRKGFEMGKKKVGKVLTKVKDRVTQPGVIRKNIQGATDNLKGGAENLKGATGNLKDAAGDLKGITGSLKNLFVGGSVAATSVFVAALTKYTNTRYKIARYGQCAKYDKGMRPKCMVLHLNKQIQLLQNQKKLCKKTTNPSVCLQKVDQLITKLENKRNKYLGK